MADAIDELAEKMPTWLVTILVVALTAFFLWVFIGGYLHADKRDANPRYTIGQVTRTGYVIGPSSHSVVFFTYSVGDSTYSESSRGDIEEGCTRYLVKYAATDPKNIEFFNHICIPDSIRQAPPQGWLKPPFPVPD